MPKGIKHQKQLIDVDQGEDDIVYGYDWNQPHKVDDYIKWDEVPQILPQSEGELGYSDIDGKRRFRFRDEQGVKTINLWSDIEDKPTHFPPQPHTHSAEEITSGRLSFSRLPTSTNTNRFLVVRSANSDPQYDTIQASDLPVHNHERSQITDFWTTPFWQNIPDKPSTYPPDTHTHSASDIISGRLSLSRLPTSSTANRILIVRNANSDPVYDVLTATDLPPHTHTRSQVTDFWSQPFWNNIPDKPSTFPPESHAHTASDITSGRLSSSRLPTSSTANRFLVVRTANGDPTYDVIAASDLPSHTHTRSQITDFAHQSTHQAGGSDELSGNLNANARVGVMKNGALVGTRRRINLVEGSNVTITVADDSANEEVDVMISAAGGGGAVITSIGYMWALGCG